MTTTSLSATSAATASATQLSRPPAGATQAAGSAGNTATAADFNRFLTLLTAQLKYQDPMSPTDPTAFVAQLAQFSQVEQQTKTNTLLQQMTAALSGNALSQAAAMIGKKVGATTSTVSLPSSGSSPAVTVNVTQTALKNPRLVVLDGNGTALRSIPVGAGQNSVSFDGRSANGQRLPAGSYTVRLVGDDSSGAEQNAGTITTQGSVTEVRSNGTGGYTLVLSNGNQVDAANLTSLTN